MPYKKDFSLRLMIGKHTVDSGSPKSHDEVSCRWESRKTMSFEDSYASIKRLPYFYLQLMDGDDNPVCFYRSSLLKFNEPKLS